MKHVVKLVFNLTYVCFLLFTSFAPSVATERPYAKVKELYSNKKYFELRDALQALRSAQSAELLFYKGAVSNKFNQPESSIGLLKSYLKRRTKLRIPSCS